MFSLLCFVVFVGVSLVETDTEADGFSGEVKALFEDLTQFLTQVGIAKEKMKSNEFKSERWDRKYAIAMINVYTQPGQFYLTLNSEMKHGYPANTELWRRAADLINKAVDILGEKLFDHVYRGCQVLDDLPIRGKPYNFDHIVTASLSKHTAVSFIECAGNFLLQIDKVYGVPIERYSHYSQDKEVIIKSTQTFNVVDGPKKDGLTIVYALSGEANESVNSVNSGKQKSDINVLVIVVPVIVGIFIITAVVILQFKYNILNQCWEKTLANIPYKKSEIQNFE